jgi:hypothetical protein
MPDEKPPPAVEIGVCEECGYGYSTQGGSSSDEKTAQFRWDLSLWTFLRFT